MIYRGRTLARGQVALARGGAAGVQRAPEGGGGAHGDGGQGTGPRDRYGKESRRQDSEESGDLVDEVRSRSVIA